MIKNLINFDIFIDFAYLISEKNSDGVIIYLNTRKFGIYMKIVDRIAKWNKNLGLIISLIY